MFGLPATCIPPKFSSGGGGPISIGRAATASKNGSVASYTIGLSGGAAAAGTWIVAVFGGSAPTQTIADTVGGGGTWTEMNAGSTSKRCYVKLCNGSEPTTYTITFNGTAKSTNSCCVIVEILGANATNPDAHAEATNTATSPSATSSATTDAAVLCVLDNESGASANFSSPPSGYTSQGSISLGSSSDPPTLAKIVTKLNVGSGTISPGSWITSSNTACQLWTLLFKQ